MITVDRYIKTNLKNYAFSIGDISVIISFYRIDIGDNPDQKIFKYDMQMEQDDKCILDLSNHIPNYELIDVDLIIATSKIWTTINFNSSINKLNLAYNLLGNLQLKAIAEYGEPTFFIYTHNRIEDADYINQDDEDAMSIKIEECTFNSLIEVAPAINRYCSWILNCEK